MPENVLDFNAMGISSNLGLVMILIPFVVGLLTAIILIRSLHKRSFSDTINGLQTIRWNRFWFGVLVWGLLSVCFLLLNYLLSTTNYQFRFDPINFIVLFLISILFLPLQTTFEELVFRGYLSQGIGVLTRNRWAVWIVSSLLFGLLHIGNPEVSAFGFWVAMPQYVIIGLLLGIVSILDDGIELAMGIHAINNILSSILVTHKDSALQTAALFNQVHVNAAKDTIELVIMSTILILIFANQYKWRFGILNQKIENKMTA